MFYAKNVDFHFLSYRAARWVVSLCDVLLPTVQSTLPFQKPRGGTFSWTTRARFHLSFARCFYLIPWTSLVWAFALTLWRIGQVSCNNILPRICSVSSWVAQTVSLISLNSPQSRIIVSCRNYKKLFKACLRRVYCILGTVLIRWISLNPYNAPCGIYAYYSFVTEETTTALRG